MPQWSAGLLPAPLNSDPGMKLLEQAVNSKATQFMVDVRDFGVSGNGAHDDTTGLQNALNALAGTSGCLYIPNGVYTITTGLTYTGAINRSLVIRGESEAGQGSGLPLIRYAGPGGAGTYVMKWTGMSNSVIRGIAFSANDLAQYGLWIEATNDTGGPVSDYNLLDRCGFVNPMAAGGIAIALGHATGGTTPQLDMLRVRDCQLATTPGVLGKSDTGIKTLTAGNVKNFRIEGGQISGFRTLADFSFGSGTVALEHVFLVGPGDGKSVVYGQQCEIALRSCQQEGGGSLLSCAGSSSTYKSATIDTCYWAANPLDDVAVNTAGACRITSSNFLNNRVAGALPLIVMSNSPRMSLTANIGSLYSEGNYYQNAGNTDATWPFQDGSGNKIPGFDETTQFYKQDRFALAFVCVGDKGGTAGNVSSVALKAFFPTGGEYVISLLSQANDVGTASILVPTAFFMNLLKSGSIGSRNEAGTGNVPWMAHNTDDSVQVGGTAGVAIGGPLKHQGTTVGLYNVTPVVRAGAITTPNTQTAAYVQADVTSLKTAIDAIRVALQNVGITS